MDPMHSFIAFFIVISLVSYMGISDPFMDGSVRELCRVVLILSISILLIFPLVLAWQSYLKGMITLGEWAQ